MDMSMERWFEATKGRFSVRKYKSAPSAVDVDVLKSVASELSTRGVRIELGDSELAFKGSMPWQSKIHGTTQFAAFIAGKGAKLESVGYMGEAFILECTSMGLGTCWTGASYNKPYVMSELAIPEGEKLVCVTPIGISDEEYVQGQRRSIERLTGLVREDFASLPQWQRYALECARRAPSAVNRQPWAFTVEEKNIRIESTGGNFGYGMVDFGIAMLHMELGAAHCGVYGEWHEEGDGDSLFVPYDS